jgi:hypothetical protein
VDITKEIAGLFSAFPARGHHGLTQFGPSDKKCFTELLAGWNAD